MCILRVSVALAVSFVLACGGSSPPPQTSASAAPPALLVRVPAETPYLLASLTPLSDAVRKKMLFGIDRQLSELPKVLEDLGKDREAMAPWIRAALAIVKEMRSKDPTNWWRDFGFDPSQRFVIYGLSLWPVMRIEVANPTRLREVIGHALAAAKVAPQQASFENHAYWRVGNDKVTFVAAVLDREAVIAVLPTPAVTGALPQLLGGQLPAKSLAATTTLADLQARHHLTGYVVSYIDARRIVDIIAGQAEIDAPIHELTGPVSSWCRTDLERLAAISPRLVFGYRRVDEVGFDALAVIESPTSVTGAVQKLHATVPEVTERPTGAPLFAFGAAVEPNALFDWLRAIGGDLHDHPFTCPWFAELNRAGGELAQEIDGLPAIARSVRGVSVVIDNVITSPLRIDGHLLVVGDTIADLVSSVAGFVPGLAGAPLKPDGKPVALQLQSLGLPVGPTHFALTKDRAVLASGPDSARRASAAIAVPVPKRSPLLSFAFDGPRLQQVIAALDSDKDKSSSRDVGNLVNAGMSVDVSDEGFTVSVSGSWAPSATIATPRP